MRFALILATLLASTTAQAWEEPQRGTQTRSDMMNAIRPHVEWLFGTPIEFVVYDLRVEGDVGFASLQAQRPGGGQIDFVNTPGVRRGEYEVEFSDGSGVQALLQKSGNMWVATHYEIGATDVWWFWPEFCPIWGLVIPEGCAG